MRYGAALLAILLAFVAVTVAAYLKVFTPVERVTLRAPSAGLQLGPRADVKLRGVLVGEVESLAVTPYGAEIVLALDPERTPLIDSASTARLLPKTLFGEKFVDLVPPARATIPISDGDVIRAAEDAVELGQVLDRLLALLRTVRPERLNATLTALATALEGRGARLGATLDRAGAYLDELAPSLTAIRRDVSLLADVTELYGDAAPDLLRTLANGEALGRTVTGERKGIDGLVRDVPRVAGKAGDLLATNETGIVGLPHVVRPALAIAATYAPSISCVFQGLDRLRPRLDRAFGGGKAKVVIEIVKAAPPYRVGGDAPEYADRRGPRCYGLPDHPPAPFPEIDFRDGHDDLARLMLR